MKEIAIKASELEINYTSKLNPVHVQEGLEKGLQLLHRSNHRVYGYYRKMDCNHELFLHYGAVRKAKSTNFKCEECFKIKCKEEAEKVGLTFIEKLDVSTDTALYSMDSCGHELVLRVGNVRLCEEDKWTCTKCEFIKYQEEARSADIDMITDIPQDDKGRWLYKLSCGHTKRMMAVTVRDKSFRCRVCQDDSYEKDAINAGITYQRGVKASHHNYRLYILPCGCTKEITPACVRYGAFECKTHDKRTIDLTRNIIVYLIKISLPPGDVVKVGFAGDTSGKNNRYVRYGLPRESIEPLIELVFENGERAVKFEKELHKKFSKYKIHKELLRPYMANGFTECYPIEMKNYLFQLFDDNKESDYTYYVN